ncbi:MAG: hypothetical protein RMJ49_01795 [Bacteroidia bacterium]|nr:hypothetical protein [Bacteroidia bacterium]
MTTGTSHQTKALLLLGLLGWLAGQPLSGNYIITGTSDFSNFQFRSIQEAFDSLARRGASGTVTILLPPSGTTWTPANEPDEITLAGYACAGCRVSVILDRSDILRKAPTGIAGERFIFRFGGNTHPNSPGLGTLPNGGRFTNFLLDGRGRFALKSTSSGGTTTGLIGLVSTTGVSLNVSNFFIVGLRIIGNTRSTTFSGIYVGPDASLTTGNFSGTVSYLTIANNAIDSVSRPIVMRGLRTTLQNVTIRANRIGLANPDSWGNADDIGAIHIAGATNVSVAINTISGFSNGTFWYVAGIRLDSCENFTIERNWIYGLHYTGIAGYPTFGIRASLRVPFNSASSAHIIRNNMLADLVGDASSSTPPTRFQAAIYVTATANLSGANLSILHNSIHLFGNNTISAAGGGAACGILLASEIQGGFTIVGNLIQHTLRPSTGTSKEAIGLLVLANSPSSYTIDYNAYLVEAPGGNVTNYIARIGTTNYTFPNRPGANDKVLETPAFNLGQRDLHLSPSTPYVLINASTPGVTDDFDGEGRPLPNPPNPTAGPSEDPGDNPDIGADELEGRRFVCPTQPVAPNLTLLSATPEPIGSDYLWGATLTLDTTGTNSPAAAGRLSVIYSLDGGATWTQGPLVASFPFQFTLPPLTPPNYTGTIRLALRATALPITCPGMDPTPDTSDVPLILSLRDRPGNRRATAIPIALTHNGTHWVATVRDSTIGGWLSSEYGAGNADGFQPRGTGAPELFFQLVVPACLDSLDVELCDNFTSFDTYVSLIHTQTGDTIAADDGCSSSSLRTVFRVRHRTGRSVRIRRISGPPLPIDTLRLARTDTLLLIVESFYPSGSSSIGRFQLDLRGYGVPPRPAPTLGPDQIVCASSTPLTLEATTVPPANEYRWIINNNPPIVAGSTYNLDISTPGAYTVVAQAIFNPPLATCSPDTTSATILVLVEAPATLSDRPSLGADQTICAGSILQLNAAVPNATSYRWFVNNQLQPDNTPLFNFSENTAGTYTIIAEAILDNLACPDDTTRDTLEVTVEAPSTLVGRPNLGNDQRICGSANISLDATVANATTYRWFVNGQLQPTSNPTFTFLQSTPGTYTIIAEAILDNLACPDDTTRDTVEVVLETSSLARPDLGSDFQLCVGSSRRLEATVAGATTYRWIVNGQDQNISTPTFNFSGNTPGTYTIIAEAIADNLICPDDTTRDTVEVTVSPLPAAQIRVGNTTYNSGNTYVVSANAATVQVTFEAASSTPGNTYSWGLYRSSDNSSVATGNGNTFTYQFTSAGSYYVVLTSRNGACEERDTLNVNVTLTTLLISPSFTFSLRPNPNSGDFRLEVAPAGLYEIRILDAVGRLVHQDRLEGSWKEFRLALPAGIYEVLLAGEGSLARTRLIITQ